MRTLCFGGSFNPIHNGHLICAQSVAEKAGYERVLLIPSAQPPHKPADVDLAPTPHRLAMCRLAAQTVAGLDVDDVETRRSGPSYTLDTVHELGDRLGTPIHWLIGADMLLYLPKWHRPLDLLRDVDFVIMRRPGYAIDWVQLPPEFRHLESHLIDAPLVKISATEVRRRVKLGEPIDDLVPPPVSAYIAEHHLYRT